MDEYAGRGMQKGGACAGYGPAEPSSAATYAATYATNNAASDAAAHANARDTDVANHGADDGRSTDCKHGCNAWSGPWAAEQHDGPARLKQ